MANKMPILFMHTAYHAGMASCRISLPALVAMWVILYLCHALYSSCINLLSQGAVPVGLHGGLEFMP